MPAMKRKMRYSEGLTEKLKNLPQTLKDIKKQDNTEASISTCYPHRCSLIKSIFQYEGTSVPINPLFSPNVEN